MTTEGNKQLIAEFFARFSARDMRGVLDMLSDDVTAKRRSPRSSIAFSSAPPMG
ncbi:MAG TPA: hypothetical protein VJ011_01100 [Steroidobacteraceae bacterium]|nr:hypothetical protein [Steroidobacteraceae bacterium]